MPLSLSSRVSDISGIGESSAIRLQGIGIKTARDLFLYFPRDYIDFSQSFTINQLSDGIQACIIGKIVSIQNIAAKYKRMTLTKLVLRDQTGEMEITWFNQPYLTQSLKVGMELAIAGKVEVKFRKIQMAAPFYEIVRQGQTSLNTILPVYREPEGITSKWLRKKIEPLLSLISQFEEWLPDEILVQHNLLSYPEAIKYIHFPVDREQLGLARKRLAFDELFLLQLRALSLRLAWQGKHEGLAQEIISDKKSQQAFLDTLPFILTGDQQKVIKEILNDMSRPFPMLRLLEGDVGSGKTIVAAIAAYMAMKQGGQVAFMAPTEVLARQHYAGLMKRFVDFGFRTELLVGSTSAKQKKDIKIALAQGTIDCIIGTHALIEDDVQFQKLVFVIIDEQHRFGVKQRQKLKIKGNPHLLNMTATPIPRTMALTLYGDQDLSIIKEMPPGRKEIITRVISPQYRQTANRFIADHVRKGRQIFVICPLVEESEALDVKSATQEYKRLQNEVFPDFRIALLHGKMKSSEKETIMQSFKNHDYDILVSTSVIEVGIDIPNASIIVIEGAERFGLAQLHQFRGRVGRGEHQSYCLLFTSKLSQQNRQRMKAMMDHSSGFDLAEIDLKIRGPGEVFGTRQSGIPDLRMAELSDREMIEKARSSVEWLLEKDPNLEYYFRVKRKFERFLSQ